MIFEHSIIRSTGQIWKVRVWAFGTLASFAAVLVAFLLLSFPRNNVLFLGANLFGTVLIISSFLFAIVSIRCPKCGTRWVLRAVFKKHGTNWYDWLADQTVCPVCGYNAEPASGESCSRQSEIEENRTD